MKTMAKLTWFRRSDRDIVGKGSRGLSKGGAAMKPTKESGQALLITALALVVLSGFAGLGIDMGMLRFQKRLEQTAADSAAIAGASNLAYSGVPAAARNAASTSGFADSDSGAGCVGGAVGCISVAVNVGPATGPHAGNANYVEVLVSEVHPTYFMKILGINSEKITARAVATNLGGGTNSGCLYTLNPNTSGISGININGNASLNAPSCGIVDNGNFDTVGNAFDVTAATFGVAGDPPSNKGTVTCTQTPTSCPTNPVPASGDPFSYLTPPCSPCAAGTPLSVSGKSGDSLVVNPGTYSSISLSGTGNGPSIEFNPGTYIINGAGGGNFTINGNAAITGSGVTFYFTNGATIDATGGGSKLDIQLSPPTTGTYAGILMYQDPADTSGPSLGGDDSSKFAGALYFPKSQVTFFGNGTSNSTGIVVAGSIALSGHPTLTLQGSAGLPPGVTVIKNAILVE
jgi:Putative Flp pilus-assembly TadE/G-like